MKPVISRRTRFGAAVLLVVVLVLVQLIMGPSPTAAAHVELLESEPSASISTPGPVPQIRLTFTQPLIPDFAAAQLTTSRQPPLPLTVQVEGAMLIAAVPKIVALTEGEWTIAYRIVADDGHPVTGEVRFIVTAAETGNRGRSMTPSQVSSPSPRWGPDQRVGGPASQPMRWVAAAVIAGAVVAVVTFAVLSRLLRREPHHGNRGAPHRRPTPNRESDPEA